jgi:phospholipid transport system substrate-binding protein
MLSRSQWLCGLLFATLALQPAGARGDETAASVITAFHGDLTEVMKSASGLSFEQRVEALTPPVRRTYTLDVMALKVLGPRGKKLSGDDTKRWTATFTRFIVANYARRLTGYSGQVFETLGEEPAPRDTMFVRTRLVRPDDEDVRIDYRTMKNSEEDWKVVDVYSNGTVSELALRRAEFAPLLAKRGLEELITTVERQAATP